jgi:hypothetical protein
MFIESSNVLHVFLPMQLLFLSYFHHIKIIRSHCFRLSSCIGPQYTRLKIKMKSFKVQITKQKETVSSDLLRS